MSAFYQEIITQKSWQLLTQLKKQFDFILIGGWAVYLYTKALKSKDIDLIIDFSQLDKLKQRYDLFKNSRLNKYEIKKEGIDIDLYLPYFSHLGLPVEQIIKYTNVVEAFTVLKKEVLLITKQQAYQSRRLSIKGQKDKIDILSLVFLDDFDFDYYRKIIKLHKLTPFLKTLRDILMETKKVEELGFNQHFFSKKKKQILKKLLVKIGKNL